MTYDPYDHALESEFFSQAFYYRDTNVVKNME